MLEMHRPLAASLAMPDTRKNGYVEGDGQVENR
jgi:hypothetical protein